eukprot:COSAG05_NODE_2128_length_3517_cov_7.942657_4_plen_216_part_01
MATRRDAVWEQKRQQREARLQRRQGGSAQERGPSAAVMALSQPPAANRQAQTTSRRDEVYEQKRQEFLAQRAQGAGRVGVAPRNVIVAPKPASTHVAGREALERQMLQKRSGGFYRPDAAGPPLQQPDPHANEMFGGDFAAEERARRQAKHVRTQASYDSRRGEQVRRGLGGTSMAGVLGNVDGNVDVPRSRPRFEQHEQPGGSRRGYGQSGHAVK